MTPVEFNSFQIEALLRAYYFSLYAQLEKDIKKIFSKAVVTLNEVHKNKLYFYHGSSAGGAIYPEYSSNSLGFSPKYFRENETFNDLTLIKIIKFDKKDNIINFFNFNIQSLSKKSVEFPFHDAILKLINMRNLLAHEPKGFNFKDKDIIEVLSPKILTNNTTFNIGDIDANTIDDNNKAIYSNLIYMENVIATLTSLIVNE